MTLMTSVFKQGKIEVVKATGTENHFWVYEEKYVGPFMTVYDALKHCSDFLRSEQARKEAALHVADMKIPSNVIHMDFVNKKRIA